MKIIYTLTDEAPALATYSLLPIVKAYAATAGVQLETRDISLSGRILAAFPESLEEGQRIGDALAELGELAKKPEANIVKLPNISASIPQLTEAIGELQKKGFGVPDYPQEPDNEAEREIKQKYAKVLGSAVNPVLREGNSDRRVAKPVKQFAKQNPHSMGAWENSSRSRVASMPENDFFGNEKSLTVEAACRARIEFVSAAGETQIMRELSLEAGEVIDSTFMSIASLREYLRREIEKTASENLLLSLHLKATMMKVSDPIIFGHVLSVYFEDVLAKHRDVLEQTGFMPKNGLGDLMTRINDLPQATRDAIEADVKSAQESQPDLAMVDSDKGITNLHVPSDVIIDASMPAAIRSSGKMWGPDGKLHDTVALIPDRSYSGVYQATIDFCKANGAFDPTTMGNVSNVGLMARKAEEYGSHDKTFEVPDDGTMRVCLEDSSGDWRAVMEHAVHAGDLWRMCQTKDEPIQDWVRLAIQRARATGDKAIFWLNSDRAHDAQLIQKVEQFLPQHDTSGLDIEILTPEQATTVTCQRCQDGLDTISVTGNVLRDYLTDLFPILELGTSAKMLSIVPLLAGGGLYETGAGGSAPKHVEQLVDENHLRWDSLGEFLALAVSLEDYGEKAGAPEAKVLAQALNEAVGRYLDENKAPSRKVGEIDNRGSHFYLALYWAQALASQQESEALSKRFATLAGQFAENEGKIVDELKAVQGGAADIGGYYRPDPQAAESVMRPSSTFNQLLENF